MSNAATTPASPPFVIFDLDGTLIDSRGDIAAATNAGLAACGLGAAPQEVITGFVGDGVGRLVDRTVAHVGGDVALAPQVVEHLLAHYRAQPVVHTTLYPELAGTLERLAARGHPLAIASNKPTDLCRAIAAHYGWTGRLWPVLGADWGGPKKPAPDALLHIAESLGRPPSEGVMVGDSVADLEAGRAAGMTTVAALYGYRPAAELEAAGPDHTLARLGELPELLARIAAR
jgi:phosphoglycolate phosphatase